MPQVTEIGDNCPKCYTPVVLKDRPEFKPINSQGTYYYKKYLYCPNCKTPYFQPQYKVYIKKRRMRSSTEPNRAFRKEIMILFRECPNELKTEYGRTIRWW